MTAASHNSNEFLGHPKGLYVCFATEMWERFSFYGMKYILLLYLTKYHLFSDSAGYDILGAYAGLVYALPLIGGLLADRYLGTRKAVIAGAVLLTLGHATMAYEGSEAVRYLAGTTLSEAVTLNNGSVLAAGTTLTETITLQDTLALNVFFFALALITVGVGFLKPNISTIVGQLYPQGDPRRDAGFTIFYMGINLGAFVAILLCGWLGETYGWRYGFGVAGIGMLIGLVTFIRGQKHLHHYADPTDPIKLKQKILGPLNVEWSIYLGAVASLTLIWWLVQSEPVVHLMQNALLIVAVVGLILYSMMWNQAGKKDWRALALAAVAIVTGLIWALTHADVWLGGMLLALVAFITYGFKINKGTDYSRTVVLMALVLASVLFWSLFEQAGASMTFFTDRVLDRTLGDTEIRASQYPSLNSAFIILFAIPLATLWVWLSKKGWEPSTPVKFGLGIMQAGLGFGALVLGAQFPDEQGKVAMIWMVLAYLLHTLGELCISPVGLSAVTKLSIHKVVGASMGTWFVATSLAETVATRIAKLASIDQTDGSATDVAHMLGVYTNLFEFLMWLGLGAGIALIIISPLLKKAMRGIN